MNQEENGIRLNKYIAEAGICSRREADKLIADRRVKIDGNIAKTGTKIQNGQKVTVDGKLISKEEKQIYLAFYKPRGIVCTEDRNEKHNIIDYIKYPKRITYCGRLDKDSEGLIIMTNDGDLANRMMRSKYGHEKEYQVSLDHPIKEVLIEGIKKGVYLPELNVTTKPCEASRIDEKRMRLILTQGLNRQIRRMCEQFGYEVKRLVRTRVMNITTEGLKVGSYRELTRKEMQELREMLDHKKESKGK
ncbi:MAG: pseudouridine synthase [Clostridia bacterium]|nr:pseudouridine synthase [Clostridia bacterium]